MITRIIKSLCFRPTALIMAFAMMCMSFNASASNIVLKSGTTIPLELVNTITSKTASAGQMIDFRVVQDITVDGKTVIPAGSIAKGQVSRIKKNGLLGAAGELEIIIRSVTAIDGTNVYLSGCNLNDEGGNKLALSIVLTVFCLFGFLIKGGSAEIVAGTQCLSTVASNVDINIK